MKIRLVQNGMITLIDDIEQTQFPPRNGFYWIDASLFDLDVLQHLFGLHDLAIEDCIDEEEQRPKLEVYEDHYFIVINSVEFGNQDIFCARSICFSAVTISSPLQSTTPAFTRGCCKLSEKKRSTGRMPFFIIWWIKL